VGDGTALAEAKKRILVVDDSEDLREFYRFVLEGAGYEVIAASSGQEGFEQARAHRPDLIILDVAMPSMGGLEVLDKLRSELAPPVPPTILISGFDMTEEEALRRGALMFVRKPVTAEGLLTFVAQGLLGRRVSAAVDARERALATAARRRAREAAAELVREIEARAAPSRRAVEDRAVTELRWLANYFGFGAALFSLMRDDRLTVLHAAGITSFSPGVDLAAKLPQCYEVLETGASLVLADASNHPCCPAGPAGLGVVRFFAGVPLLAPEGTPVGVLCVLDARPRAIAAEDLLILEHFGRLGSSILSLLARGRPESELPDRFGPGVWARDTFALLSDAEARLLHRSGGSMDLAVIEVDDAHAVGGPLATAAVPDRLAAGLLGAARVAIYTRDAADGAARQVQALLREVGAAALLRAAGAAAIAGAGLPAVAGQDLFRLAELALDQALQVGGGTQRLVLQHEVSAPAQ
jgi:CheY-like chemotaxis protein